MFGLEHAAAIVHVFAEDRPGLVVLAKVTEDRAQAFGGIKSDRIVAARAAAAINQIAADQRLGLGAAAGPIEQRGQEIARREGCRDLGAPRCSMSRRRAVRS